MPGSVLLSLFSRRLSCAELHCTSYHATGIHRHMHTDAHIHVHSRTEALLFCRMLLLHFLLCWIHSYSVSSSERLEKVSGVESWWCGKTMPQWVRLKVQSLFLLLFLLLSFYVWSCVSYQKPRPSAHRASVCVCVCVCVWVAQSCLTLCDPMDCSPSGSSVHGILQARTLGWVAICRFMLIS